MQAPKFSRRSFLKSGAVAAAAASLPGFSLPAAAAAAPIGTVCQTQHGPVQGIRQEGHLVWYGIPYGASTAGDARWTAPQDPAPWADAKDCTVPGAAAYQYSTCALGTEDCLKLDVYTTEKASKRPVIVYLHSGGNQIGSARELPGGFLAEQLGCVFVGLEYRLGLFGFNCLPAFCSGPEETGNFALLDMAKALDWVRDNIASFGGDPQNITVLGFAAGGRDGMALLASPLFVGRFQKAISISGGMTCADETTSAETLAAALAPLAVQDGKALTEATARRWLLTEDPAVRSWLCGVDAARLAPLMANAGLRMSVFPHLYADGITLPEGVTVGAVVAVNAVGDVYHPVTGECIACASLEDGTRVRAEGLLCGQSPAPQQLRIPAPGSNTTIGVVAVDCALTKEQANRLADVAHDGLARAIRPVHTQMDGDTMFALATGRVGSDVNFVKLCAAAAEVTARAIANAILFSLDA